MWDDEEAPFWGINWKEMKCARLLVLGEAASSLSLPVLPVTPPREGVSVSRSQSLLEGWGSRGTWLKSMALQHKCSDLEPGLLDSKAL